MTKQSISWFHTRKSYSQKFDALKLSKLLKPNLTLWLKMLKKIDVPLQTFIFDAVSLYILSHRHP